MIDELTTLNEELEAIRQRIAELETEVDTGPASFSAGALSEALFHAEKLTGSAQAALDGAVIHARRLSAIRS